jgi:hypothetical protein
MATYNTVHDLANSKEFDVKHSYFFFINLLDEIFGKHDDITVDEDCETHKDFIKDHWKMIDSLYSMPSSTKSTKKVVRQTLKNIIDYLNTHYQLKNPVEFKLQRKGIRIGEKTTSVTYSVINLIEK